MSNHIFISEETENRWQQLTMSQQFSREVMKKNRQIQWLWEQSSYCANLSQKYPDWIEGMISSSLQVDKKFQDIPITLDEDEFKKSLREFRNQSLLNICWRDLILQEDIYSLLNQISLLAD